jgi:broad specificity phosphatase PhoE
MRDTLIDFLRHGEPVGGRRYRGDGVDDPLSEKGWQQMWAAVGDQVPWQRVVSSPLQRCQAFAAALADRHRLGLSIEQRFREVGQGVWEGLSPDQIQHQDAVAYAAFYHDPSRNRPQGAEDLGAFGRRVSDALEELFVSAASEHVLVVAHAGVIRAALGHVLQSDPVAWYRTRIDNAALTRFRRGPYGNKLEFHNLPSLR